jgi:flagellar basal-body rod modification protein FlgD
MASTNPLTNLRVYDPVTANKPKDTNESDGSSAADQTQTFLKLLTAQIKNQDPMSPMDASTMTAQTSNLSMVNSMQSMNASLKSLLAQMQSANFITQASSIGHSPLVSGNTIAYDGQSSVVALGASVANPLTAATALVSDEKGNQITNIKLGALNAGMKNFVWNGRDANGNQMPAGNYRVSISGTTSSGGNENPTAYVAAPVMTVSKATNGSDVMLNLLDGRSINANDVIQWVS